MKRHGEYKAPGGKLIVVDLEIENDEFRDLSISGDFFLEPDDALFRVRDALIGAQANLTAAAYAEIVMQSLAPDTVMLGISPEAVGIALRRALSDAGRWRDLEWSIIDTPRISPALNVALDEVLVTRLGQGKRGPTLRIWDWNADAVVIGSFQSVANEVHLDRAEALDTTLIRRISGGGAMYMQPQASITYSIYVPTEFVQDLSFEASYAFLDEWVLEALYGLGIDAQYVPLNDIASPAGKIGGAAQKRLASGALLHHVTMAYNIDADRMTQILRIGQEKLHDKGTRSAAKRVDPLRTQTGLSREEIVRHMREVFVRRHGGETDEITDEEYAAAEQLVAEKFTHPDWVHRIP